MGRRDPHPNPPPFADTSILAAVGDAPTEAVASIGEILAQLRSLGVDDVERVLEHQRRTGLRFGEAAVALGCATDDDVRFALSRQFDFPYAHEDQSRYGADLITLAEPFGARAEGFRTLRSQLNTRLASAQRGGGALAVVSANAGEGRSYVAANLAVSLAQLGGRTLLMEADMRQPRLHETFRFKSGDGLANLLAGRATRGVVRSVAGVPGLYLLPAGSPPPNPLELVERPAFNALLNELRARFSHVVIDTPAASQGGDAAVIAARCGTALIVARRHSTSHDELRALQSSLCIGPMHLAGVVLNER
jgi:protein-tyrosine kinase